MKPFLYVLVLLIIFACNKKEKDFIPENNASKIVLTQAEYRSLYVKPEDEIDKRQIIDLVEEFINLSANKPATKASIKIKDYTIRPVTVLTKANNRNRSASLYSVMTVSNTDDSSTAIVSAKARIPQVIAFVNGSKELTGDKTPESVKLLVESSLSAYEDKLNIVNKEMDSVKEKTLEKIALTFSVSKTEIILDKLESSIAIENKPSVKATMEKDPRISRPYFSVEQGAYWESLMFTAWSNGMPYNRLMPQNCPDNWLWDYRYPVSSAVIAISQILAAYVPAVTMNGITMDWDYLTADYITQKGEILENGEYFGTNPRPADPIERKNMVAELMRGVTQQCGITYTCTGAQTNITTVKNFLSGYNINMGSEVSYNFNNIRPSISNYQLVLMYGQTDLNQGHWWLIDGGMIMKAQGLSTQFIFIHTNMNQGEYYNGYYLMGDNKFETGFATFTKNFKLYPGIVRNYSPTVMMGVRGHIL